MPRTCLWLAPALLAALAGCGPSSQESGLPTVRVHTGATSNIVIEAEDAASVEAPVMIVDDKNASGGRCISIPGGSGKPGEAKSGDVQDKYPERWGAAIYKFTVPEAGKYRIWGRKFWEDGCGNSFTFVVNGGAPIEFGGDSTYDSWEWLAAPKLFPLKAGENRLEVLNREDGVRLDKILITRDTDYIPQGKE